MKYLLHAFEALASPACYKTCFFFALLLFTTTFLHVPSWANAQNPKNGLETLPIAIDVGHSIPRGGATSARGRAEYSFNKVLAEKIQLTLHSNGLTGAFLIAPEEKHMAPGDRARLAHAKGAALLLSIHHDSVQPKYLKPWTFEDRALRYCDLFQGYSLFYSEKNPSSEKSLELAHSIGQELRIAGFTPTDHHAEPIKGENRDFVDPEHGIYRFDDLLVLKSADTPSVLLEAGVILNRIEERALNDPARQQRMSCAVCAGILKFLGLSSSSQGNCTPLNAPNSYNQITPQ